MPTSILDFVSADAIGAAANERYGTKAAPTITDRVILGDAADSDLPKLATVKTILDNTYALHADLAALDAANRHTGHQSLLSSNKLHYVVRNGTAEVLDYFTRVGDEATFNTISEPQQNQVVYIDTLGVAVKYDTTVGWYQVWPAEPTTAASPTRELFLGTNSQLAGQSGLVNNQAVNTLGAAAVGDSGGRDWIYHDTGRSALTATIRGIFYATGGGADDYYERRDKTEVRMVDAGVVADGTTDNKTEIATAVAEAKEHNVPLILPSGNVRTTEQINLDWAGAEMRGVGPRSVLLFEVNDQPGLLLTAASDVHNFSVGNTLGFGAAWVGHQRSRASGLWAGRGMEKVSFWNVGVQELRWSKLETTTNGTQFIVSSQTPEHGFYCTNAVYRLTPATSTGLSGLTLNLTFVAAAVVTVSGNTRQDLVDSINAQSATTKLSAFLTGDGSIALAAWPGYDGAKTWQDNDLVLADGTGSWTNAGLAAGTYTETNFGAWVTNASTISDCESSGAKFVGFGTDGVRHSDQSRGEIYLNNSVFQGNGTDAGAPTFSGDFIANDVAGMIGTFHSEGAPTSGYNVMMDTVDESSFSQCLLGSMSLASCKYNTFLSCVGGAASSPPDKIVIDANCVRTTFIGGRLEKNTGTTGGISDLGKETKFLGCVGFNSKVQASGILQPLSDSTGMGESLAINGNFEFWDDDFGGETFPLGWAIANNGIADRQSAGAMGTYYCRVTTSATQQTITSTTATNPVVVNATSHGFNNGDIVGISGVTGMTQINNRVFTVANASANAFELSGENGLAYSAGTGGTITDGDSGLKITIPTDKVVPVRDSNNLTYVTVRLKARRPTGSEGDPVAIAITHVSKNVGEWKTNALPQALPSNEWRWIEYSAQVSANTANVVVTIIPDRAVSGKILDIDAVVITSGLCVPTTYVTGNGESNTALFLNGKYIDYGTAIPTAGRYNGEGSIRFKTTQSPSDFVGWVCTTRGDPGTWVEFGATQT